MKVIRETAGPFRRFNRIEVSVMKKICGFAMFWVAVGMVVMMFIPETWIALFLICTLLIVGYNLFC
ncbi:MAG: hypothetical protein HFH35_13030 [Eubacterium sp.]|nr:hypothetical protein [Eubacterium sp.]